MKNLDLKKFLTDKIRATELVEIRHVLQKHLTLKIFLSSLIFSLFLGSIFARIFLVVF